MNDLDRVRPVDILAIGSHPDDVELSCIGTLMKAKAAGQSFGILDLTMGELGTRGSGPLRLEEAAASAKISGAAFRHNARMADGFFDHSEENKRKIIEVIRASQPKIVLCNALRDRHPDHAKGANLQSVACFLSGLRKIETSWDGQQQSAWRPKLVLHYIQDYFMEPHVVVDISEHFQTKMDTIMAFKSQFYDPNSPEPMSSISSKEFIDLQEGKALQAGRYIGATHGEGYLSERPLGIDQLSMLI